MSWDLESLFVLVRRQWRALGVGTVAALLAGVIFMHVSTPVYTVSVQIVPAPASLNSSTKSGLSALTGGILGGDTGPTSFKIYTSGLQSHAASEMIARDHILMRRMFSDQWSEKDQAWMPHYGPLHPVTSALKWVLGVHFDDWHPPSADDVYTFLQENVDVVDARDSPIVTVSIRSREPQFAADFLRVLIGDVDMLIRERALSRANEYIDYIGHEMNHVTVAEYRAALVEHLNDQEKTRMMASATKVGYAADVFSGPMVSQKPTSPKLVLTLLVSLVIGCFLGFLLAIFCELRGCVFTLPFPAGSYTRPRRGEAADGVHH